MVVVDTNILVYAADEDSPFHRACLAWLQERRRGAEAWYVTWPILYEFLRVTTHPRVMRQPWHIAGAWKFVTALLASPGLGVLAPTPRHAEVAGQIFAEIPHLAGNLIHDSHTAIFMREHGLRQICRRDMDFHRFGFLKVIDPLQL